jgi:hypothetical protein
MDSDWRIFLRVILEHGIVHLPFDSESIMASLVADTLILLGLYHVVSFLLSA